MAHAGIYDSFSLRWKMLRGQTSEWLSSLSAPRLTLSLLSFVKEGFGLHALARFPLADLSLYLQHSKGAAPLPPRAEAQASCPPPDILLSLPFKFLRKNSP